MGANRRKTMEKTAKKITEENIPEGPAWSMLVSLGA